MGELVRERRISAGLTQRELAAAAGVSIGALRDLEQGRTRCPRWGAVAAIAAALGLDQCQQAELASAWSGEHGCDGSWYAVMAGQARERSTRIGVLGPLTARLDGAVVRLGSPRQRAILGMLGLHWPAGVSRDVIIDVLWGEHPPRSAVTEVQAYVSQLRQLLDPRRPARAGHGGPVLLADRCYRLGDAIGLDSADFGQLSRHARMAAARGEFRLACALCERSLALWRGEVLADVGLLHGYPAAAEAGRRRGDVVLCLARAAAACRRPERALPYLQTLCACEPFNEQAHAYLMTALAASGLQAAALQVFWQLKSRLDSELGIRPGPQLAAAHLRVLRQQAR
jgi:DNA-binding SARP family transcriptional activator/DNA-binding XRE family transcriptional regulator